MCDQLPELFWYGIGIGVTIGLFIGVALSVIVTESSRNHYRKK
jgi:NhaP-type Na+/H+ or K+/H+ antiporter